MGPCFRRTTVGYDAPPVAHPSRRASGSEPLSVAALRLPRQGVGKTPGMTEGIDDAGVACAPERIPRLHRHGGAGVPGALHGGIAILDLEMHGHRSAFHLVGREHGIDMVARAT